MQLALPSLSCLTKLTLFSLTSNLLSPHSNKTWFSILPGFTTVLSDPEKRLTSTLWNTSSQKNGPEEERDLLAQCGSDVQPDLSNHGQGTGPYRNDSFFSCHEIEGTTFRRLGKQADDITLVRISEQSKGFKLNRKNRANIMDYSTYSLTLHINLFSFAVAPGIRC